MCLLHEYVQQSLKTQPYYSFTELDNAATPYAATVRINELEYGRGTGSSKKIAKSEAARSVSSRKNITGLLEDILNLKGHFQE